MAPITFLTFNILCSVCTILPRIWFQRSENIETIIAKYDADFWGLQEVIFREEVERFRLVLPNMSAFYYDGPPLEALPYADSTIYYNNVRFRMIENGVVWLGPYPDEPWSTGFVGRFPRTFVWGLFEEIATGRQVYFSTTHYSNNGNCDSKIPSSELVIERAGPFRDNRGVPVILTGDFNSAYQEGCTEAYLMLLEDGYINTHDVAETIRIDTTPPMPPPDDEYEHLFRIDHILIGYNSSLYPNVTVSEWIENREVFVNDIGLPLPPSDHQAMVTTVDFWND